MDAGGKGGVRETVIEVERQDVVAVSGNAELGVGLAWGRADDVEQLLVREIVISCDGKGGDAGLQTLLDFEGDEEVAGFAAVVILNVGLDLGREEAVREIEVAQRGDVGVNQAAAEAVRNAEGAGSILKMAAQNFVAEIFVADQSDADQAVVNAAVDVVGDDFFGAMAVAAIGGLAIFRCETDLRIEIALAFEALLQVAAAFFEEVGVNGAFLINGNKLFEFALRNLGAGYGKLNARAFGDLEIQWDGVGGSVVFAKAHLSARAEVALFDQEFSDARRAALDARGGDLAAGFHLEAAKQLRIGVLRAVGDLDGAGASARAGRNRGDDIHFPRVRMGNGFDRNARLIEALVLERVLQTGNGFVNDLRAINMAELELHGRFGGSQGGRRSKASNFHDGEEEVLLDDEIQPDAARDIGGDGFDAGEVAAGVEGTQGLGDGFAIQGLTDLDGQFLWRCGEDGATFF